MRGAAPSENGPNGKNPPLHPRLQADLQFLIIYLGFLLHSPLAALSQHPFSWPKPAVVVLTEEAVVNSILAVQSVDRQDTGQFTSIQSGFDRHSPFFAQMQHCGFLSELSVPLVVVVIVRGVVEAGSVDPLQVLLQSPLLQVPPLQPLHGFPESKGRSPIIFPPGP